jgi:hypothetical protein
MAGQNPRHFLMAARTADVPGNWRPTPGDAGITRRTVVSRSREQDGFSSGGLFRTAPGISESPVISPRDSLRTTTLFLCHALAKIILLDNF